MPGIAIYLETAAKRSFAVAVDWPGWARSGKTEEAAIEALLVAGSRYASVAERAGEKLSVPSGAGQFHVTERLVGGAGTEFGVPGSEPTVDRRDLDAAELDRLISLLEAAWATFDDVAADAAGVELRKGPRGGGRDLVKIRGHVQDAEEAYLRQVGRRPPREPTGVDDRPAAIRAAMVETLRARVGGDEIPDRANVKRPWSPRYAIRRSAWHTLDHAWEIEDRSEPG